MARSSPDPEPRWGNAAALILLCGGGVAGWWGDLGSGLLWLVPVIIVAALTAAGILGPRAAIVLGAIWLPGSLLAAGLPAGTLTPAAWDTTSAALREGIQALPTIGAATPNVQRWALAAVLLVAGSAVGLAGLLWRRPGRLRELLGFALLLVPLGAAIAFQGTADSAWQGTIVLAALVLRVAHGRLVPIVTATAMVGAIALFGAQVAAPRAGWQPFGQSHHLRQFRELNTGQTYGPLEDRRTGAVMLDVTAPRPSLWRMQVLEAFDNRRWLVAPETSRLPEPAAVHETTRVEVRGLRSKGVVAPGREFSVHTKGGALATPGAGFSLVEEPQEGLTAYRVEGTAVHANSFQLREIPVPKGRRYEALTQIGLGPAPKFIPYPLSRLALDMPKPLQGTDWARLFRLSWHLSAHVESELDVVRRVEDYLLRQERFRYTTDVPLAGREPLLEFLFHTHAGYCQHFAGAAALLLRAAGIPSRVVVGFATGEKIAGHTWAVRDQDAHAWIEVYFPGVGWVPFNPTPASAPADISPGLDVLQAGVVPAGGAGRELFVLAGAAAALALLALAGARLLRRRGPRTELAELLVRLGPQPSGPGTTLRRLHLNLTEIGPATADLALVAERARFAADAQATPAHPGLMVWRALVADLGLHRALRTMLGGGFRAGRAGRPSRGL